MPFQRLAVTQTHTHTNKPITVTLRLHAQVNNSVSMSHMYIIHNDAILCIMQCLYCLCFYVCLFLCVPYQLVRTPVGLSHNPQTGLVTLVQQGTMSFVLSKTDHTQQCDVNGIINQTIQFLHQHVS